MLDGAVVSEVNNTGKKLRTFVHAAGSVIAWQVLVHYSETGFTEFVYFEHADASGTSRKMTNQSGAIGWGSETEDSPAEFDPMGNNAGYATPYPDRSTAFNGEGCIGCGSGGLAGFDDNNSIYVNGAVVRTSTFDGATVPISLAINLTRSSATSQCPSTGCAASAIQNGQVIRVNWNAFSDGYEGYMPIGSHYAGGGHWSWQTQKQRNPKPKKPTMKKGRTKRLPKAAAKERRDASKVTVPDNEADDFLFNSTEPNRRFIVFGAGEREKAIQVKQIAYYARNESCSSAFSATGATSVNDQITKTTIVTESVFLDSAQDSRWAPDNDQQNFPQLMRDTYYSSGWPISRLNWYNSTNDVSQVGDYLGRRFIGLTDRAFSGNDGTLNEMVVHSFLHSGGVPGVTIKSLLGGHDLRHLGRKYHEVMRSCLSFEAYVIYRSSHPYAPTQ